MSNSNELLTAIMTLRRFIAPAQIQAMIYGFRGEEKEFFAAKIAEYSDRFDAMPKTYEQEGKGDQAIVSLHYFKGACDWYITERDMEEVQQQAFGLADLGYGGELGYISIEEIIKLDVELDLYFKPCTLASLRAKRNTDDAMSDVNYVGHPCHY